MNKLFDLAGHYYAKAYHILNIIVNIILYIVFFLLNLLLMLDYWNGGEYWFLFLTFSFTIPPATITTLISLIMAWKSSHTDYMKKHKSTGSATLFEAGSEPREHLERQMHKSRRVTNKSPNTCSKPVLKRAETIPSPAVRKRKPLLKQRSDAIELEDVPEMDNIDLNRKEVTPKEKPNFTDCNSEEISVCSLNGTGKQHRLSVDGKRKIESFHTNAMVSVDCIDQVEMNLNPKIQKCCFIIPHFILQPTIGW